MESYYKRKKKLKKDIEVEITNLLNSFVEGTSFNEDIIINCIKEVVKEMRF